MIMEEMVRNRNIQDTYMFVDIAQVRSDQKINIGRSQKWKPGYTSTIKLPNKRLPGLTSPRKDEGIGRRDYDKNY